MAENPNFDKQKPLLLATVAKSDPSNMFRFGGMLDYDPKVRLVVFEVESAEEFVNAIINTYHTYGNPELLFITAHGGPNSRSLIFGFDDDAHPALQSFGSVMTPEALEISIHEKETTGELSKIKLRQIIVNSCYGAGGTGLSKVKSGVLLKDNIVGALAKVFDTEACGVQGKEGLLSLSVVDTADGIKLKPTFMQWAWPPISHGKCYDHSH